LEEAQSVAHDRRAGLAVDAVRVEQRVAEELEVVPVLAAAVTVADAAEDLRHALVTVVAGRAAPAGLVFEEVREERIQVDRAGAIADEDHAATADERTVGGEWLAREGQRIEQPAGQVARERPSGLDRLELPPVRDAAAGFDHLRQGHAPRHLHEAGAADVP